MDYPELLQQRTYVFSIGVIRFCRTLPCTDEAREVASQLRRASNSAAANYKASRRGRSRAEWFAKMGIVLEEIDEADHWMSVLRDVPIQSPSQDLITECQEIRRIIAKSISTGRENDRRSNHEKQKS